MRPAAVPPFRTLDPALATAERLLASALSTVVLALPDEQLAAARLNRLLAGTRPRLTLTRQGWRVACVAAGGRSAGPADGAPDEHAAAAGGLAALVAVAGWSRLKRCETCAEPFLDRTNGRTRRWCTTHRPRHKLSTTGRAVHSGPASPRNVSETR